MKYKTALSIIGDNPIGILTWGQIILPPANAKLSKVHLSVTMDHTGNELLSMLESLPDADRIRLMESIVSVDHMTVQLPDDPLERRKQSTLPYAMAIGTLTAAMAMVAYDMISKDSKMDGTSLVDFLKSALGFVFGLL